MSTAAKITFATTCIASAGIIYGVYRLQETEREALHQGPIKDRERQRLKQESKLSSQQTELTPIQKRRQAEYELQKKQFEEYSSAQPVSDKFGQSGDSNENKGRQ